jgi:hypothetical protein
LAELIKIREEIYTCSSDADAAAIAEYEKKRIDEQTEHKKKLDSYFKMGVFLKDSDVISEVVSTAAISGAAISGLPIEEPVNIVVVPDEKDDGFVMKF